MQKIDGILISGCLGESNLGDDLMLQVLTETLLKVVPPSKIYIRGKGSSSELRKYCDENRLTFIASNLRVVPAVQVIAGGSLFLASSRQRNILIIFFERLPKKYQDYLAAKYFLLKWMYKPDSFHMVPIERTIAVGVGLSQIPRGNKSKLPIMGQLSYISRIFARDHFSKQCFQSICSNSDKISLGTDLTFSLKHAPKEIGHSYANKVVVVIKGSKSRESEEWHSLLLLKLLTCFEQDELVLLFIGGDEDELSFKKMSSKGIRCVRYDGTNSELIQSILEQAEKVLSERLHGILLASRGNAQIFILGEDMKLINFFTNVDAKFPLLPVINKVNLSTVSVSWFKSQRNSLQLHGEVDKLEQRALSMEVDFLNLINNK